MLKPIVCIAVFLFSLGASAQTNLLDSTYNWTSFKSIDLYTNLTFQDTILIRINNSELILKSGDIVRSFRVENVQGSWSNLSTSGQLTFDVPISNFMGSGKIQNQAGVLFLILDLSARNGWMKRKFFINN